MSQTVIDFYRSRGYRPTRLFFFGRALFRSFFRLFWRCTVKGSENIPGTGGVIIAPNHASYADPPLVGSSMKRPLYFMAKKELFDMPVLGFLIRRTNAFPVSRGRQDIGSVRFAEALLKDGRPLLIFPEGTRTRTGAFGKARPGVAMIACHARVPVVPVRVVNSFYLGSFRKLTVIFGKPVMPPAECAGHEAYQAFAERILEEIKGLA